MKRILLLFASIPAICFTQNYQTIQPNLDVFFEPTQAIYVPLDFLNFSSFQPTVALRALKMVPTDTAQNMLFFSNFKEVHSVDYQKNHGYNTCVSADKLSWIGGPVIIHENGYNIFFNRLYDSIFINTQAQLNESFTFYTYSDSSYFLGTVTSFEPITFLEVTDSAKTINLQFYNSDNEPGPSSINGTEIILTKNFGFYKVLNFLPATSGGLRGRSVSSSQCRRTSRSLTVPHLGSIRTKYVNKL